MSQTGKTKYLVQCKHCGQLLFKKEQGIMFDIEIKCSGCQRMLKTPQDVVLTLERLSEPSLDRPSVDNLE